MAHVRRVIRVFFDDSFLFAVTLVVAIFPAAHAQVERDAVDLIARRRLAISAPAASSSLRLVYGRKHNEKRNHNPLLLLSWR